MSSHSQIALPRTMIPVVLWLLVAIAIGVYYYSSLGHANPNAVSVPVSADPPGAVFVDIPWKHLPDVEPFQFVSQDGQPFDSATLAGKPYLVSFFFASCPSICRQLNNQLDRLNQQLRKEDIALVSITVDPENDTPDVLKRYAEDYNASPDRWAFLTDQGYKIRQLGEQVFRVVVDKDTHTDNILLVDKWGRYRDRFKWDDPYDMKRLVAVVKEVAAEKEPPLEAIVHTRNALAGLEPVDLNQVPWIREFHLTERNGETFFSRDLTGQVWIANFFFSTCPGICKQQNAYLRNLRARIGPEAPLIVSMTTDPTTDTPEVLREFAQQLDADNRWLFCTGPTLLIRRIASEFFKASATESHHSSLLFVVDRWGKVRGNFDWRKPEDEVEMLALIKQLEAESRPTSQPLKKRRSTEESETPETESGDRGE